METRLHAITFDCADPRALASFWSEVLGKAVDPEVHPTVLTIGAETDRPFLVFQGMESLPRERNRVHADFLADDLDRETDRLVALGATVVARFDLETFRYTTMADPEGNWFDLTTA